ncbi:MAG: ATP-dependent protease ATPase subunit HslU [Treponema sp.]|uniref:ATP-dependent protease ATPase subunit HslU n=1 Tax=Treponema sp. TaxID=166 RepID=UPI00298E4E8D|nr:ATP-dependent protease ATPase subunit HslU [Treponema sp.]MCQ2599779.1 ATP-dependent protease ATPase subunit HslU [Treponema sp.]
MSDTTDVIILPDATNNVPAVVNAEELTPRQIVEKLDSYIIGQKNAKKAVAVALRNRTRRLKLSEDIREEVTPKNILMIGPTGVGKTEIARRLAKLCGAPFLKVEATKYTEVGYVGRDVESMVRDLMAVGFNNVKHEMEEELRESCKDKVEERLLDLLLPGSEKKNNNSNALGNIFGMQAPQTEKSFEEKEREAQEAAQMGSTREKFRTMLREGKLEDREVEISVTAAPKGNMSILTGGSMDDLESAMQNIQDMMNGARKKQRTVSIAEARKILTEQILDSMVDADKAADIARERVQQSGIIFIDEIDKIAVHGEGHGPAVSREGVQRDILPIVEGCHVNTKWGVIDTKHILFIAAGAFSLSKPSDLIPELQGRFPLRVELDSLNKDDFKRILTEPKNALIKQYTALLGTEGVTLDFKDEAIERISSMAEEVNSKSENIGARRLHTIMEKVLDEISFEADEHKGETISIDASYVDSKVQDVASNEDLSRYIL